MATQTREDPLQVRHPLAWTYERSTGPVFGQYLAGLRAAVILGGTGPGGEVVVPPPEAFPDGRAVGALVPVGPGGSVVGWTWQAVPRRGHPLDVPFAWALILLDGATAPFVHAVAADAASALSVGMRVRPRWRGERLGEPADLVCFEGDTGPGVGGGTDG